MDVRDPGDRAAEVRAEHARLAREVAATAELSARVHDEVAQVHDRMTEPLLDPQSLREHAERDRRWAAEEREVARSLDPPP